MIQRMYNSRGQHIGNIHDDGSFIKFYLNPAGYPKGHHMDIGGWMTDKAHFDYAWTKMVLPLTDGRVLEASREVWERYRSPIPSIPDQWFLADRYWTQIFPPPPASAEPEPVAEEVPAMKQERLL